MEDFDLEYRNNAWHVMWGGEKVSSHASWGEALYAAVGRRRADPPEGRARL